MEPRHKRAQAIEIVMGVNREQDDTALSSQGQARPEPPCLFEPPAGMQQGHIIRALQAAFAIRKDTRVRERAVYYDTFDWRLFNNTLTLVCTAHHASLRSLSHENIVCQTEIASPPVFLTDIPPGAFHTRLAAVLEVRALLELFTLVSHSETLRVMNDDQKTVVRIVIAQHRLEGGQRATPAWNRVRLTPVKGYAKEVQKVRKWLVQNGFTPSPDTSYQRALAAVGKEPNDYVSKPRFQFDPMMRADAATKHILRFLLTVMRRNEAGIIADVDTEFLHDFRVAIRRTRSALGQIKGAFPTPLTERFRKDFAFLGSVTNRMRDLDVYLLRQDDYKAKLSEHHRHAIDPLFAMLQHERAKAHRALVRHLHSKRYHDIAQRWDAFLATPCHGVAGSAANASRPILTVARKRIKKKCRAVVTLGMALLDSNDAQGLHALRIECKKLRYLLEFFDSLFPAKQIMPLVRQLRKLQDNLGDFHDLCVQQADLHAFADRLTTHESQEHHTQSAIGGLIEILDVEKTTRRAAFPKIFTTFAECAIDTRFTPLQHA
jgi:CHAD domain-containing protein